MPLLVPIVGENVILENITNRTAPQNLVLRLFQSNTTPADTDTAGTYTESTFPGYGAITLIGASWNAAASGSIAYSAQQTITCSGSASQNVYGYYITQVISGILMWAERDASAPFAIANSGDAVKITPTITAE